MTAPLRTLIEEAEARLHPADRERLAALIETFVDTYSEPADFTPEELEHLKRIEAEPFVPADPAEVAALFARRG